MTEKAKNLSAEVKDSLGYLLFKNPVLVLGLVIGQLAGGCTNLQNAAALSVTYFFVVVPVLVFASAIGKKLPQWIKDEVYKVSHRAYCEGFYFGRPEQSQYYGTSGYVREYDVVAIVEGYKDGRLYCQQKNKFNLGDEVEVLSFEGEPVTMKVGELFDEWDNPIDTANHAAMKFSMTSDRAFAKNSIIRMKK